MESGRILSRTSPGSYNRVASGRHDWFTEVCLPDSYSDTHLTGSTADTNAPDIQAAYWVGGYQDSDTTVTITDSTEVFSTEMIQLNTTTGEYTSLDPPFPAVQEGSLSYLPVGELGILVYIGGEVPSIPDGVNVTLTSVSLPFHS